MVEAVHDHGNFLLRNGIEGSGLGEILAHYCVNPPGCSAQEGG
jgi:hypothetical protein